MSDEQVIDVLGEEKPVPMPIVRLVQDGTLGLWGSECLDCGNATAGSWTCDDCGSDQRTTALYIRGDLKDVEG